MARIFLSPPHVGPLEREMLLDAFDSNWIAPLGPHVDAFEREMCEHLGGGHAVALASGTAALHLALLVLGVGAGDEVLTSTLTFAATANAIRYVGATPVFVDADRATWNMDPTLLEQALDEGARRGRLPKAVVVVDLYGQCADYDRLGAACARHGVPIVEDAAEALGASYRGRPAGTLGELAILSFNGNKIITTSGGGMLLARDRRWTDRARYLATQARAPVAHYEHADVGYNYRLSNLLAALGRAQLRALSDRVARRREIHALYRDALAPLDGVEVLTEAAYGQSNCWLTCVTLDAARCRRTPEQVRLALERDDIETRPVWKPMHLQPVFAEHPVVGGDVAAELFRTGLCLPSGSSMTDADVARVIAALQTALGAA